MTTAEATRLVALLMLGYPNQELSEATKNLYVKKLQALPLPVGARAVQLASGTYTFFPSLAELLQVVSKVAIGAPGPMEAWEQAVTRGASRHPLVRRAMHAVGGEYTVHHTDKPEVLRGQFVKAYNEFCKLAHDELHTNGNWEHVAALPQAAPAVPVTRLALPPARTVEMDTVGKQAVGAILAGLRGRQAGSDST